MSDLQSTDACAGDSRGSQAQGMHEQPPLRYPRKRRENWPFKFYEERGKIYQNIVRRVLVADRLDEIEEAPL